MGPYYLRTFMEGSIQVPETEAAEVAETAGVSAESSGPSQRSVLSTRHQETRLEQSAHTFI